MRAAGLTWGAIYVKAGVLDPYQRLGRALDSSAMSAGLAYLRGRRRRFAALLLPPLLLRALIPFGFMPLIGASGLTLGFCPGEGALPAGLAAATVKLLHAAQSGQLHHAHAPGATSRVAPRATALLLIPAAIMAPQMATACASCGCTLSADAATGYSALPGLRFNLEYDFINQDRLRTGTGAANAAQVVNAPSNPALGGGEIERQTINRYLTLGVNYTPDPRWNFTMLVPYVMRTHTTYGQQSTPYTSAETAPDRISGSRLSELGDLKDRKS